MRQSLILQPLHHSSFSNLSAALPTSQLILQPIRYFTYIIGTSSTSQLILQSFCCFTYATAHSTALPLLHLHHRYFTYITAHSPTLLLFHLRHISFYNHLTASPTSQVILQPFWHIVSRDSSFSIHNALYFVKYPSRAGG